MKYYKTLVEGNLQWTKDLGLCCCLVVVMKICTCDLMIFCLPDGSFLYMYDKIFYLQLEVRHSELDFVSSYRRIFTVLHKYLILVCNHLHFNPQKLQYGFLCTANQSGSDHIVIIDLLTISEFMPGELPCSRGCSRPTKLKDSHKIWLEQVSILMSIVSI